MADMDLEDLDGPQQAPTRAARFAPKGSKFKPQPKPKKEPVSTDTSLPVSAPKKEELDFKPSVLKDESDRNAGSSGLDRPLDMDVDAKPEEDLNYEPMETEGSEDEVVREIDVCFTPSIDATTQLYVLQYPLRPSWRPYEMDERCEEVRVKPASSEVEVDLAVDTDSNNYDVQADPRLKITKQTLSTAWKPSQTTGYAVGVLIGKKLHLSPIHAVVQLRPSMQHLSSAVLRKKNPGGSQTEGAGNVEEPNEVKPIVPSKKQGKPSGTSNDQSKDIGENCLHLKYHGTRSEISSRYLWKMMAHEGPPIQFSMAPSDYVNALCPGTLSESNRSKEPPRRFLLTLPLEERFKIWLIEGPPIHRFDALKHLAPDEPIDEILNVLRKHAQLVQGLWVPKSSLFYGRDHQGIEVLARDFVLLLFSKSPVINNSQLPQRPQLAKAMKDVLNILAMERSSLNDWKLREHPDMKFVKLYPDIVEEQEQAWERLEKQITDHVFGERHRPTMKNPSKSNISDNLTAVKSSTKVVSRTSNGMLSKMSMSEETREALPKALQKLLQTYKVCSFQQICQRLREMAVSESSRPKGFAREARAAANGVDAPQEELQAIISQVAINIHGAYVLKSSADHPQYDDLRKVVIDLLIAEGPSAKLKKASIVEAAKLQLKREINNIEYQKVLQELCISQGSVWILKSGDGNPR